MTTPAATVEREQIAREILAQQQPCGEPFHDQYPKPSCWYCARNGAFARAARIALGTFREPE